MTNEVDTGRTGSESLSETAYRRIEEWIVTLRLTPGSMTTEQQLCQSLAVGRTPVREALLRLAQGFLVTIVTRRGVLIRPIEVEYALMTVDVRRTIERLLVRRAARYAEDFERQHFFMLADRIEKTAENADIVAFMRADDAFNRLLGRTARHDVAARTIAPLHCVNRRLGYFYAGTTGAGLKETGARHAAMMRAIANANLDECDRELDSLLDATVAIAHAIEAMQAQGVLA